MSITKFKNWWSTKPYWFKGGILGILILPLSYLVVSVPVLGFLSALTFGAMLFAGIILSIILGGDNRILFTGNPEINIGQEATVFGFIVIILIVTLVYFFIGAFLGFIVGKIMSLVKTKTDTTGNS